MFGASGTALRVRVRENVRRASASAKIYKHPHEVGKARVATRNPTQPQTLGLGLRALPVEALASQCSKFRAGLATYPLLSIFK